MNKKNTTTTELAKSEPKPLTVSESFANKVQRQFVAEAGQPVAWTNLQRSLAQHLFLKIDSALATINEKKSANDKITWQKVDMTALALSAVNRIQLELDALMPNHIHVIPYKDNSTGLYKLDLRIGYEGYEYVHLKYALDPSVSIRTELVYETDEFWETIENGIVGYHFKPIHPFDSAKRGKVVGGFGYISYDNPRKNKLVIVDQRDFDRSQRAAQTQDFWAENKHQEEMKRKTVKFRVCAQIPLDPVKVNSPAWQNVIESPNIEAAIYASEEEARTNAGTRTLPQVAETSQEPADERVRDDEPTPEEIAEGEVVEAGQAGMAF